MKGLMKQSREERGSTLLLAIIFITVLSLVAANVLMTSLPRLQASAQGAAWQEAMLAAETGLDLALGELSKNSENVLSANWGAGGWRKLEPRAPGTPGVAGAPASGAMLRPSIAVPGSTLVMSETIVRDNISFTLAGNRSSQVDVQVTALWPDPGADYENPEAPVWFRIRAMGTTSAPGPQRAGIDPMDAVLRRVNFRTVRASLRGDDNLAHTVPLPNVSRTVEVIARPIPRFPGAMLSRSKLILPPSGNWIINSYYIDSNGQTVMRPAYTGLADIGSIGRSNGTPHVDASWRPTAGVPKVNGNILVNGDPAEIAINLPPEEDPWRDVYSVHDDFDRTLRPAKQPQGLIEDVVAESVGNATVDFTAGTATDPKAIFVDGNLGSFTVRNSSGKPGRVIISVKGNLILPNQANTGIQIEGDTKVEVYVQGKLIDLANGALNTTGNADPLNLRIYGVNENETIPGSSGNDRTISVHGNYSMNGTIYAPYYDLVSKGGGNGQWKSALVANSIDFTGGGASSFLFLEALLGDLESSGFEITRYFEDFRK